MTPRSAVILVLLAGCAGLAASSVGELSSAPSPASEASAAPQAPAPCPAAPPRIVHAKDGGPTLLSPADLAAIERYIRACSEGR